jgi:hypothetical protein
MPKAKATSQRAGQAVPWYLSEGDEECPHCGQWYAYELEIRCPDCDAPSCPHCKCSGCVVTVTAIEVESHGS